MLSISHLLLSALLTFFADKYEDLYSCVSYSVDDVKKISDELNMALRISVLLVTLMW